RLAQSERERILGGLVTSREMMLGELLETTRQHLTSVVKQLEVAMAVAASAQPSAEEEAQVEAEASGVDEGPDPQADDLLGISEGFDIMLPEFFSKREDPEEDPRAEQIGYLDPPSE